MGTGKPMDIEEYRRKQAAGEPLVLRTQSARHALSQARGEEAEDLVERRHAVADFWPLAEMVRVFTPRKPLRDGRSVCIRPQGPDFHGWWRASARPILVEVKHETDRRFNFGRLNAEQRRQLGALDRDGGIAVVLVLHGPVLLTAGWHAVPYGIVAGMLEQGAKSMAPDELAPWRVDPRAPYLAAPWLHRPAPDPWDLTPTKGPRR